MLIFTELDIFLESLLYLSASVTFDLGVLVGMSGQKKHIEHVLVERSCTWQPESGHEDTHSLATMFKLWLFHSGGNMWVLTYSFILAHSSWHLAGFKGWQDVEGTLWDSLPVARCWGKTWNMSMHVLCACVFVSKSAARFLLCQSVTAVEHHGPVWPSINRLPRHGVLTNVCVHDTRLKKNKKNKNGTRYFIKRLQLLWTWAIFFFPIFPRIQHGQQVVPFCHFPSFSACEIVAYQSGGFNSVLPLHEI